MLCRVWLLVCLAAAGCYGFSWDEPTHFDYYINRDDGAFKWVQLGEYRYDEDRVTLYLFNMTSQYWMDASFSSQPVWWHMMGIAVPDTLNDDIAYLWIDGGGNGPGTTPPGNDSSMANLARRTANATSLVVAFVLQVPNQGIVFANDPSQESRTEDEFIAWTWKTFADDWPNVPADVIARLPMAKSAKRGLDTIHEFMLTLYPKKSFDRFIVGGGSKRGWTAWAVAAMDPRIIGVTPAVMSLLNLNDSLQSHCRNLGNESGVAWSIAFWDYYVTGLTGKMHEPSSLDWEHGLWTYEDAFRYKERLGLIPKLMISATGDEFFLPTDHHSWWKEMPGEKYLMMVPNAEHSLAPWYIKIGETVASFMLRISASKAMPHIHWIRSWTSTGAKIVLQTDQTPTEIRVWTAHTWHDVRKDFRLVSGDPPFIQPIIWTTTDFVDLGDGNYEMAMNDELPGYVGFFFELMFLESTGYRMYLTSEVQVTPNVWPAAECYGMDCYGYLI